MNEEARGPEPEDAPAPPASTRWSEDAAPEADELPPPFTPGRTASGRGEAPAPATPSAPSAETRESEPFPFETPEGEAEGYAVPDHDGRLLEEAAGEGQGTSDILDEPEDDFPFDHFDIEGGDAVVEEPSAESGVVERAAGRETGGWTPADLEMGEEPDSTPAGSAGPGGAGSEVAELLERMARLLREDGVDAVREEIDSPDRLTALLAGLVAGYVTGRS